MLGIAASQAVVDIVHELLGGLSEATDSENVPTLKLRTLMAQVLTVLSWCTYIVGYLFPMLGIAASQVVVAIQIVYCVPDKSSKCEVQRPT